MMDRSRNVALFFATSAIFGTSVVGIKVGVAYFPPVLLAALRFLIGGAIFFCRCSRFEPMTGDRSLVEIGWMWLTRVSL